MKSAMGFWVFALFWTFQYSDTRYLTISAWQKKIRNLVMFSNDISTSNLKWFCNTLLHLQNIWLSGKLTVRHLWLKLHCRFSETSGIDGTFWTKTFSTHLFSSFDFQIFFFILKLRSSLSQHCLKHIERFRRYSQKSIVQYSNTVESCNTM